MAKSDKFVRFLKSDKFTRIWQNLPNWQILPNLAKFGPNRSKFDPKLANFGQFWPLFLALSQLIQGFRVSKSFKGFETQDPGKFWSPWSIKSLEAFTLQSFEEAKGLPKASKLKSTKFADFWKSANSSDFLKFANFQGICLEICEFRRFSKNLRRIAYFWKSAILKAQIFENLRNRRFWKICGFQKSRDFHETLNLAKIARSLVKFNQKLTKFDQFWPKFD